MAHHSSYMSSGRRRQSSSTHQPMHRRPFYSQNSTCYNIYTSKNRRSVSARNAGAELDQGLDNFSYDPDHLAAFKVPSQLTHKMPDELYLEAQNWALAGAALCTSLDRIHALYKQGISYAYPVYEHPVVISCRLGNQGSTIGRARASSSTSLTPTLDPESLDSRISSMSLMLKTDPATLGVFSPPITPVNSYGTASPVEGQMPNPANLPKVPTLSRLDSHSSSSAISPTDLVPTVSKDLPACGTIFDEITWETYLNKFKAELDDAQYCLGRFQGYARKINVLRREYLIEGESERTVTVSNFIDWWIELEPKVSELQRRVEDLEMPDVDYVRVEWELARHEQAGTSSASELVFSRE